MIFILGETQIIYRGVDRNEWLNSLKFELQSKTLTEPRTYTIDFLQEQDIIVSDSANQSKTI